MHRYRMIVEYDGGPYVGWQRQLNGVSVQQVVEEAFAPLVRLHPAAERVIPVAARRWRGALTQSSTWQEIAAFRRAMEA